MEILTFKPIYMERVWGGRDLESKLGRVLPEGKVIGESWELVDRPEAQSVVEGGPHDGMPIAELRKKYHRELFGPDADPQTWFPILVKWLDCQERLSLQVHPPAAIAPSLGGEPKTETWYIADCKAGASLTVGLKKGVTRAAFEEALASNELEKCVHAFGVAPGDSILVESGRLHAINGGNLILEIQQNSDTTYRVYDWGRVGLDGRPRELHKDASLKSIDFDDFEPEPLRGKSGDSILADCAEFRIRRFERSADGGGAVNLPEADAQLVHLVRGEVFLDETKLEPGRTYLVPYTRKCVLQSAPEAEFLVTDRFLSKPN